MKKRRILSLLLAFSLAASVMSGCGKGNKKETEAAETSTAAATDSSGKTSETLAGKKKPGSQNADQNTQAAESAAGGSGHEEVQTSAGTSGNAETQTSTGTAASGPVTAIPVNVGWTYDYRNVEGRDDILCWYEYSNLDLDTDEYPALAQSLKQYEKDISTEILGDIDSFIDMAMEIEPQEDTWLDLYSKSTISVPRADTNVVSLLNLRESYAGGVHPSYWYGTVTYDTATGRQLMLQDIVNDPDSLPDLLEEKILPDYRDALIVEDVSDAIREEMNPNSEYYSGGPSFCLEPDGIRFYFSPYELTAYASGGIDVKFLFQDYPDLVKTEYQEAASNSIVPVAQDEEFPLASGGTASWSIEPADDYAEQFNVVVKRGTLSRTVETWAYTFTGFKIDVDGKELLAVESVSDNDWHMLHVFDLNTDGLPEAIELPAHFATKSPTDSTRVRLSKRVDMLSTYSCERLYRFTGSGQVEPLEPWFHINFEGVLTSKKEITAESVSEADGSSQGQKKIPAGTSFSFVRTDGETWVDMRIPDGTLVRLNVSSEWPITVNGEDAQEVFDNMMFAG